MYALVSILTKLPLPGFEDCSQACVVFHGTVKAISGIISSVEKSKIK